VRTIRALLELTALIFQPRLWTSSAVLAQMDSLEMAQNALVRLLPTHCHKKIMQREKELQSSILSISNSMYFSSARQNHFMKHLS